MAYGDKAKVDAAVKRRLDSSWVHGMKRNVQAYMAKRKKKASADTPRTEAVTSALSASGLTEAELKRLRGG
jgi:hypothetical protein